MSVLFYAFSLLAIASGVAVVTLRNAISSAVALVVAFFALAAIYAMLGAHFVAVIQILVYAGAIMVLFVFVIMLLNLREEQEAVTGDLSARGIAGVALAAAFGGGLIVAGAAALGDGMLGAHALPAGFGTIETVGKAIFGGRYLLPFEVISALLTVGVVGAVVLAKREL